MSISANIQEIRKGLSEGVRLVVVTKTRSIAELQEAYDAGVRDFGENRVQELLKKAPLLPPDIRWHLIGHLQSNKVKQAVPIVSLIHSIDSIDLLKEVSKEAAKAGKTLDVLLQFHIAMEQSKYGFQHDEIGKGITAESMALFTNVNITGVMGMATFTDDSAIIRKEFRELLSIFNQLKSEVFPSHPGFREVSMGMSDDYPIAIEEGSTIIRVGTAIFGERLSLK